jgi:tRNA/rRNA methyltransferase
MRIPTRREHESMNLGQAVAVCLWELSRGAAKPIEPKERKSALSGDLSRIEDLTLELLRDSGYLQPPVDTASVLKLRRLIRRMSFNAQDAQIFLGMLRQIRWRFEDLKAKAPPADL